MVHHLIRTVAKRLIVSTIACCVFLAALSWYAFSDDNSSQKRLSGEEIAELALLYEGFPYIYGGSSPSGFDCSGFVQYVYRNSGYEISRVCSSQYYDGEHVAMDKLCAGDIVLFSNTYMTGLSHAGIYLGDNRFIHAANAASGVTVTDLSDSYYLSRFTTGVRVADSVCPEDCVPEVTVNIIPHVPKNSTVEQNRNSVMRMPQ